MSLWPFGSKRQLISNAVNVRDDWPLESVLLNWSSADKFTFRDAMAGILILGAIGSGKTTASGRVIALSMLLAGFGFLVLCAKPDEADAWEKYCRMTGREGDLIRFSANGPWRFDALNYELTRTGAGAGLTENLLGLLTTLVEVSDRSRGNGSGGREGEAFWKNTQRQMTRNLIDLIVLAKGRITVPELYQLVISAPTSRAEVSSPEWRRDSFCFRCLVEADQKPKTKMQQNDFEIVTNYLLGEFAALDIKTRAIIVSSFTATIDVLNRGLLRELFCTETNVTPAAVEDGKIIVVDLPLREYGDVGLFASMIWKHSFQKSIERRLVARSPRPVTLWCDEVQNFLDSNDTQFQATCRSARVSTVLLSQNLSNFYAAMGGERGKAEADSLLANLNTKIFHANGDHVTNSWASDTIGRSKHLMFSGNSQQNNQSPYQQLMGNGVSSSTAGFSEQIQADVEPAEFTQLRTGGPSNKWLVDAILFANGVRFRSTGKCFMRTFFSQK